MLELVRAMKTFIRPRTRTLPTTPKNQTPAPLLLSLLLTILASSSPVIAADDVTGMTPADFQIPAASLADALSKFGSQSGLQVVYAPELARGLKSRALSGRHTIEDALKQLLEGTGLTWSYVNGNTVVLKRAELKKAAADGPETPDPGTANTSAPTEEITVLGSIPEVLVYGSRSLNTDIQRSEDDAQPYVVFDRGEIEHSQAVNLEDFFRARLPMNAVAETFSQTAGSSAGNRSSVNLRGLGTNQTLILVDGRRLPSVTTGANFQQGDVNGIPLAFIERIEVLPSTASGIYGGGAMGGVINIITRQQYSGVDLSVNYASPFESGGATRRIDASAGFSLNEGNTLLKLAASHEDVDDLFTGDRDFVRRARALQLANNRDAFFADILPPAGYTTNLRTLDGSNLVLDSDGTDLNSPFTFVPEGYQGPDSDGGAALVANAGEYNLRSPEDQTGNRVALLNSPTVESASVSLRQTLTTKLDAFVDLSWLSNEGEVATSLTVPNFVLLAADAPSNPFANDLVVVFPAPGIASSFRSDSETIRGLSGLIWRLPHDWTASADYLWSRSRITQAGVNPVTGDPDGAGPLPSLNDALESGAVEVLRDLNAVPVDFAPYSLQSPNRVFGPGDTQLREGTLRLSGPVFRWTGGQLTLSGSIARREEKAPEVFQDRIQGGSLVSSLTPARSQDVDSYYLEANAPLISESTALPFVQSLELQASIRRDEYETIIGDPPAVTLPSRDAPHPPFGSRTSEVDATKHTFGLRYSPVQDLILRASVGTGFLPPTINQIVPDVDEGFVVVTDPKRANVTEVIGPITRIFGGNDELVPEDSESWSAGFVYTPRFLPDLRLSLDYTQIEKTDEIAGFETEQDYLNLEDFLPGVVTRAPLTAEDQALGYTAGAITAMRLGFVNIAKAKVEAYDIQADYTWRTGVGEFEAYAVATWQPHLRRQALPLQPFVEFAGYGGGLLEWRGNVGLNWLKGPWTLGWNAQYYDSYFAYGPASSPETIDAAVLNQGSARIDSQTYHDLFAQYDLGESMTDAAGGWLDGLRLRLAVQNVFNEIPPIIATTAAVGGYSTYGDPRLRRYSITIQKRF